MDPEVPVKQDNGTNGRTAACSALCPHIFYALVIAVIFYTADQITKAVVIREIPLRASRAVIDGFFYISHVTNPGAAWSILSGRTWFLLSVSFAAFAAIIFFLRKLSDGYPERIYALMLVCSGIAGNCTDRIFRGGEVVDFLDFIIFKYHYPTFNVADCCITVGVTIFIISNFLRPEKKASAAEKE